jgi:hypothetical protein
MWQRALIFTICFVGEAYFLVAALTGNDAFGIALFVATLFAALAVRIWGTRVELDARLLRCHGILRSWSVDRDEIEAFSTRLLWNGAEIACVRLAAGRRRDLPWLLSSRRTIRDGSLIDLLNQALSVESA